MKKKYYDEEFKAKALKLADQEGPEKAAATLKISPNSIYLWRKGNKQRVGVNHFFIKELDKMIGRLTEEITALRRAKLAILG